MTEFSIPVRIYYEDTDAGGIVYNANYVKFFERARTEWLRSFGIQQDRLLEEGIAFVVKHLDLDFKSPARFNDMIHVFCEPAKLGAASIVFSQRIEVEDGRILVTAEAKIACVNLAEMKPMIIPDTVKEVFKRGS